MSYSANIEGFEGQKIEVNTSMWTGSKLLINGVPAAKGNKRGEMLLQRNDGKQVIATWKTQSLGFDVPQLVVDGKVITLAAPLKWYQWVWGGWPILIVVAGGALGVVAGLIALSINVRIFRSDWSEVLKYVATGAVSVLFVAAYLLAAQLIPLLVNR
jgi:hypothetical protein